MIISPYYEKDVECLNCKNKSPTLKVRSKSIKVVHTESDFQPIYADDLVNAIYYNVFVCEHCGFSFTEDFNKYFAPGIKEQITIKISINRITHDWRIILSHPRLSKCNTVLFTRH